MKDMHACSLQQVHTSQSDKGIECVNKAIEKCFNRSKSPWVDINKTEEEVEQLWAQEQNLIEIDCDNTDLSGECNGSSSSVSNGDSKVDTTAMQACNEQRQHQRERLGVLNFLVVPSKFCSEAVMISHCHESCVESRMED